MAEHELKCEKRFFDGLADGSKTFEVRREDRWKFAVGDVLRLREIEHLADGPRSAKWHDVGRVLLGIMWVEAYFVFTGREVPV